MLVPVNEVVKQDEEDLCFFSPLFVRCIFVDKYHGIFPGLDVGDSGESWRFQCFRGGGEGWGGDFGFWMILGLFCIWRKKMVVKFDDLKFFVVFKNILFWKFMFGTIW